MKWCEHQEKFFFSCLTSFCYFLNTLFVDRIVLYFIENICLHSVWKMVFSIYCSVRILGASKNPFQLCFHRKILDVIRFCGTNISALGVEFRLERGAGSVSRGLSEGPTRFPSPEWLLGTRRTWPASHAAPHSLITAAQSQEMMVWPARQPCFLILKPRGDFLAVGTRLEEKWVRNH